MKTYHYIQWLSADELHKETKLWLSELKFMREEQLFLNKLVQSFTLQLIDSSFYQKSKTLVGQLQTAEKNSVPLFKKVQAHGNQLEILVDDIDQLKMEKAYLATHEELKGEMNDYTQGYRAIKERLFKLLSSIRKKDKRERLQP